MRSLISESLLIEDSRLVIGGALLAINDQHSSITNESTIKDPQQSTMSCRAG
jgi:hypothetical protein